MTPKMLLVDDNVQYAMLARRALRGRAEVTIAGTIAEARVQIVSAMWDAILLDVHLPDGEGTQLLDVIEREQPRALVRMVSEDPSTLASVSRAGGFLALKEDGMASLLRVVEECLAGARITETSPRSPEDASGAYCRARGMTDREAEAVCRAVAGETPRAAAKAMGISASTRRKHVSAALRKSGAKRIAEVVAAILRRER